MKERPILFSAPMVRALLAGAKTQTRRIMNPQPEPDETYGGYHWASSKCKSMVELRMAGGLGPYGSRGDRLWVKETHQIVQLPNERICVYRATCEDDTFVYADPVEGSIEKIKVHKWKPSIFMRRLESRLLLEIESVRIERLQDISEADAKAEGVRPFPLDPEGDCWTDGTHRSAFEYLWGEINGWDSWKANPWVWVVAFKRIEVAS